MSTTPTPTVECPVCEGKGEQAVPGTYGPTISPENLETRPCWLCDGYGEVTEAAMAEYSEHVANVANGDGWM